MLTVRKAQFEALQQRTMAEFERGMQAFQQVFGFAPKTHAAAGWQINAYGLELEREYALDFASDTRGRTPFWPLLEGGGSSCLQLPTTLPTFDELLGRDGIDETNLAQAVYERSLAQAGGGHPQVFTLHAELEGLLLLGAFDALLQKWRAAGAQISCMGDLHAHVMAQTLPRQSVIMGQVAGRSGLLALQAPMQAAPIAAPP